MITKHDIYEALCITFLPFILYFVNFKLAIIFVSTMICVQLFKIALAMKVFTLRDRK